MGPQMFPMPFGSMNQPDPGQPMPGQIRIAMPPIRLMSPNQQINNLGGAQQPNPQQRPV